MLKQEENELITRVGPGTPMGNFDADWVEATRQLHRAFVEHHERDPVPRPPLKSLATTFDLERLGFTKWLVDNQHLSEGK